MCLAIPGRVVAVVDESQRMASVDIAGVRRTVNVALLDERGRIGVSVGDWVLIHVGFALSRIDDDEARATLALLDDLGGELEELRADGEASAPPPGAPPPPSEPGSRP